MDTKQTQRTYQESEQLAEKQDDEKFANGNEECVVDKESFRKNERGMDHDLEGKTEENVVSDVGRNVEFDVEYHVEHDVERNLEISTTLGTNLLQTQNNESEIQHQKENEGKLDVIFSHLDI